MPSYHSGKSLSEHKLSPPIPLATLRVTMETSSSTASQPIENDEYDKLVDNLKFSSEDSTKISEDSSTKINDDETNHVESITHNDSSDDAIESEVNSEKIEETTSVEQRLKKISEEIERYSAGGNNDNHEPKSFLTMGHLFNSLRTSDKKIIPQIDSDYSNTMHVLGETASIVGGDDSRKVKTVGLRHTNRALY